jgi:hypothetical protein
MYPDIAVVMKPRKDLGKIQKVIYYILLILSVWDSTPKSLANLIKKDLLKTIPRKIKKAFIEIVLSVIGIIILPVQIVLYFLIGLPLMKLITVPKIRKVFFNFMNRGLKKEIRKIQE